MDLAPIKNGFLIVKTKVENKSALPKKISNALILVGPETDGPLDIARIVAPNVELRFTNDLENIVLKKPRFQDDRGIVPLAFYYLENVSIADEHIGCDCSIELAAFEKGKPYAVRFYIFGKGRLHRSTQRTFINAGEA